jgi:SAM-dependent methyltransferase
LQASVIDPVTIRHLESIGVAEGWRCLDVGAGTGSIAQWLSKRVEATGKVVATDIDTRFLSRISAPNLEVRRHDILKDDLETGEYDLVHCRKLLIHLSEPERALRRMADAVRAGGWLLVEEDDRGSMLSMDVADPSLTPLLAACRAAIDFVWRSGIVNPYFGRRVRGLVEDLGLVDVGLEGWTCMMRGGDPEGQVWAMNVQGGRKIMIDAGLTQEALDNWQRLYMDPSFTTPYYTLFSAWGRKPEG